MNVCSPGLSTILSSRSVSSRPIETFVLNHQPPSQSCMSSPQEVMDTCSEPPPEANLSTAIKVHSKSVPVPHDKMDSITLNQDTLNKQSDISALANIPNPEARTIPFPKKYVCSPDLSTILKSQSLSSQPIPPIETILNHQPPSQCCTSSHEEVMDRFSQSLSQTNMSTAIELHSDPNAVPDEMDSTESYDSETEMEFEDCGKSNTSQYLQHFPFPLLSLSWYRHHGRLSGANKCRENTRRKNKIQCNEEGKPISMKSGSGDCRREHSATAAPGGNNSACEKEEIFQNSVVTSRIHQALWIPCSNTGTTRYVLQPQLQGIYSRDT